MAASLVTPMLALLLLCAPTFAATESRAAAEVARVVAVSPGVFVKRNNAQLPLSLKDPLYKGDLVITDASGKAQLLFADDTTVALAPDSSVNLNEFSYGGSEPANFAMSVGQGLARVVTGKIVQKNREGFKVITPHATVGIRGTILTADVRTPAKSVFILTQLGTGHVVTVDNPVTREHTEMPKAGLTVEAAGSGNTLRPATPVEMNTAQSVARRTDPAKPAQAQGQAQSRAQDQAQASAQGKTQAQAQPSAQAQNSVMSAARTATAAAAPAGMPALGLEDAVGRNPQARAEHFTNQVTLSGRLTETGIQDGSMSNVSGLNASYAGTLGGGAGSGTFSFDLNLAGGLLSNGQMSAADGAAAYSGVNGTGNIQGAGSGNPPFALWFNEVQGPINNTNAYINGRFNDNKSQAVVDQWAVRTGGGSLNAPGTVMGGTSGSAQKTP